MTGLRYVSLKKKQLTIIRSTYVYSLLDLRNGGSLLYQTFLLFSTIRGALTYDSSYNCDSALCITTGLDLGSVAPEYKLIQKKKKKPLRML